MNLLENLYKSLSHEQIWGPEGLTPLDKFTANSGGYTACCPNPAHPEKKPSFLMKQGIPAGKCQSCGYYLTWFDTVAIHLGYKDKKVKGKDFWQVFNALASLNGGMHVELSQEDKAKYEFQHELQTLRNAISIFLHNQLLTNSLAEDTKNYLKQRGVPEQYFPRFPMLGFYPSIKTVKQFLINEGFSQKAIEESNVLLKCFEKNCLTFSYKDDLGNTLGFKARKPSLKSKDIIYQKGFKGDTKNRAIMGLECCNIAVQNGERVVPLEGEFDWFTAQVASLKQHNMTAEFICIGGSDVKPEKLETLKKAGAKVLYLSFDHDQAGKKATREAIKYAEKLDLCPFVVNLPAGLDPDDFIKSSGLEAYKNLVKNASTAGEWLKQEFILEYHPLNKENIEKAKIDLIEEAKNHKGLVLDSFLKSTSKELNIDNQLIRQIIEKQYQELHKNTEAKSLKKSLPDIPHHEEFIIPDNWILNQNGLVKIIHTKEGLKEISIAPAPFYVSSRSVNIDTRQEKLELTYMRDDIWKNSYEERSTLMDHRKIVQLSSMGFPVDSLNCKEMVNFIHNFEAINDKILPKKTTVSGFGWKKEKSDIFFIIPKKAYGTNISIFFEPEGIGDERIARAIRAEGELSAWKGAIKRLINYPKVMFQIYASFTTTLLELLDAPNFIIDNWGLTSIGKTTVITIAASVWGLPIKEQGGLVLSWDATKVSIERLVCLLNHLPIFLDDSHTALEKIIEIILYMIANGTGRLRGALKGTQKLSHWRTIAFSTGEKQLSEVTEYEGAKARIISIYGSPFGEKRETELIHKIKPIIHANYGHAGPRFIEELISTGYHKSPDSLRKEYREKTAKLARLGNNNVADRIAQYLAAVQVAGRLVEEIFEFGGDVEEIITEVLRDNLGQLKESGDYPQRALELIISWVQSNQNFFDKSEYLADVDKGEVYGVIREGEYIGIFPHKFKELLLKNKFNCSTILKVFKERNWIQTSKKGLDYPTGFRSKMVRMIKLQWTSFKDKWE